MSLLADENNLYSGLESFKTILHASVQGRNSLEAKRWQDQQDQFAAALKKLHRTDISLSITKDVPRATRASKWRATITAFLIRIESTGF